MLTSIVIGWKEETVVDEVEMVPKVRVTLFECLLGSCQGAQKCISLRPIRTRHLWKGSWDALNAIRAGPGTHYISVNVSRL